MAANSWVMFPPDAIPLPLHYSRLLRHVLGELPETRYDEKTETLWYSFTPRKNAGGTHLYAHGGLSAAILDEAMGVTVWLGGRTALAAKLDFSYHQPVELDKLYYVRARLRRVDQRRALAEGQILRDSERPLVTARGLFLRTDFAEIGALPRELGILLEFYENRQRGISAREAAKLMKDDPASRAPPS